MDPAGAPEAHRRRAFSVTRRGLLTLDCVTVRWPRGERARRERVALRGVSLVVDPGELVGVWGTRHSGRSTLVQVAAGIVRPTEGVVRFDGESLVNRPKLGVREGIGYCDREFDPAVAGTVIEHVAAPLLNGDMSNRNAERAAEELLTWAGVGACAELLPSELDAAETIRVAIARAAVTRPRVLVIDEPATGVRASEERSVLRLLHALARDQRVAVLMTVDDAAGLAGVDRALSIDDGVLRGCRREDQPDGAVTPDAPVIHLSSRRC